MCNINGQIPWDLALVEPLIPIEDELVIFGGTSRVFRTLVVIFIDLLIVVVKKVTLAQKVLIVPFG